MHCFDEQKLVRADPVVCAGILTVHDENCNDFVESFLCEAILNKAGNRESKMLFRNCQFQIKCRTK